jgi:MFS-type transporter involved in bile tolerance (Atg22 family)
VRTAPATPYAVVEAPGTTGGRTYRAGTLVYTSRQLVLLFAWMLWGDLCYTLMEQVMPALLPLSLRDFGASNILVGLVVGTIPELMEVGITPVIATQSDRHRGPRGRRIPFLLWSAPPIAIFMCVTGFAEPIGRWIHDTFMSGGAGGISPTTVIIATLAVASIVFQFANLYVTAIYFYLFNDVVPHECMGRFISLFRVVGAAAAFLFSRFVLGWAEDYRPLIYTGAGALYCSAILLMCWRVKEGEYLPPPPPPTSPRQDSFGVGRVWEYLRESFGYFRLNCLYAARFCYASSAACQNTFAIFLAKGLGMSLGDYGKAYSWVWVIAITASVPLGYIADKVHPARMVVVGVAHICAMMICAFFVVRGPETFLIMLLLWTSGRAIYEVSYLPLVSAMLPRERFGQFSSAHGIASALGYAFGSYGAGFLLDCVRDYQYIFLWSAAFTGASLLFTSLVARSVFRRDFDSVSVMPTSSP